MRKGEMCLRLCFRKSMGGKSERASERERRRGGDRRAEKEGARQKSLFRVTFSFITRRLLAAYTEGDVDVVHLFLPKDGDGGEGGD